jgi:beta-glucanase (GH16 family)
MFDVLRQSARRMTTVSLLAAVAVVPVAVGSADAARWGGGGGTTTSYDACGAKVTKASGEAWNCSFVDNFDGRSLDPNKWVAQNSSLSSFFVGQTCFVQGQGYDVRNGSLLLTVKKQPSKFTCQTPWGTIESDYTGGAVSTYGKFSQAYGRFEARLAFPDFTGAGLHGGFWMNPQDKEYGAWPASGEIDVAEWFSGVPGKVYPSLHYSGRTQADTGWNCTIAGTNNFHTYAVEWGPAKMDFIYDGKVCFTRSWSPTNVAAPAPFDKPFVPSLLASAGQGANAPTSATPSQATTVVDYVKVWR